MQKEIREAKRGENCIPQNEKRNQTSRVDGGEGVSKKERKKKKKKEETNREKKKLRRKK